MTRRLALAAISLTPVAAHMVSISTGDLSVEANRARYEIRMPLYEVAHVKDPERDIVAALTLRSNGEAGRAVQRSCRQDAAEAALVCEARYEFSAAVEIVEVRSALHEITAPNHVHLLRATRGEARDQAVLDVSFPRAELRFRPPTAFEQAMQQAASGAMLIAGGPAQWLFAIALVIAARSRRELLLLAAMFIAGEAVACVFQPLTGWWPAPRFVEAACALTIAYLAVEALWLPKAGQRWLVVGVLGLFHGLYLALFVAQSKYAAGWVLSGAVAVEIVLVAALGWVLSRVGRQFSTWQPARAASAILMAIGLGWFFLRLRG
jgi:hypothetical protein